jgi:hypothetical protein
MNEIRALFLSFSIFAVNIRDVFIVICADDEERERELEKHTPLLLRITGFLFYF